MSPFLRRFLQSCAVTLGAVGLAAALFTVPRCGAVRCLLTLMESVPEDLEPGAPTPGDLRLLRIQGRHGVTRMWVLEQPGGRAPTLLFVHGVTREGLRDGRILHAVRAFGRAGFTVVAPEMPTLVDPLDPRPAGVAVERTLAAIERGAVAGADPRRIGVVGISVGGALALHACVRHRKAGGRGLRAVLLIGAPEDLRRCAVAWFDAEDPAPVSDGSLAWERRHAAAFARSYLVRAGIAASGRVDAQARALADWLHEKEVPDTPLVGVDRPDLLALADLIRAPRERRSAAREQVMTSAAARIVSLSPALWAEELSRLRGIPIFLLHGLGDPLVAPEEAEHLARRLRPHTLVCVLESRLVGHTALAHADWGERLDHVVLLDDLFDMIAR